MEPELITIVGTILGSSLMTITVLLRQMNHLETKLEARISGLDTKFTDRIDRLDTKFTDKIDRLDTKFTDKIDRLDTKFTDKIEVVGRDVSDSRERLARVEGYLTAPEGFRLRGSQPSAAADPPPENRDTDHRQAG